MPTYMTFVDCKCIYTISADFSDNYTLIYDKDSLYRFSPCKKCHKEDIKNGIKDDEESIKVSEIKEELWKKLEEKMSNSEDYNEDDDTWFNMEGNSSLIFYR